MTAPTPCEPLVIVTRTGGRIDLCLNRPLQFNALSEDMLSALEQELMAIRHDDTARCVVISGAGKAFCAGHDLRQMQASPSLDYYRRLFAQCTVVMEAITALPVPVIARVHGIATAAGCQLVASCDLAVASCAARFAVSGINVGLFCSTPAVALSRTIAPKRAFEMLATGRFIDAETAADWGLVNDAVPEQQLDDRIAALVREIEAKSAAALRHGKALFYAQQEIARGDAYRLAAEVMAQNMMEDDAAEGIAAFLEKRQPRYGARRDKRDDRP
ncbi:enoyl-CoA hydratase [Sphingopyxis sp. LARHCG72]